MAVTVKTYASVSEAAGALSSDRSARYLGGGTLVMRALNGGDVAIATVIRAQDQALPSALSDGDVPSAAADAAAAMVVASSERPSSARSAARARIWVGAIDPSAIRAPAIRPPLIGRCAASVTTEPPFGLMRAILR